MAQRGDKEARSRTILEAGREVLREGGLGALQMRAVSRRAGVALGTVYTYFVNKETLFAALYVERTEQLLAELGPALESETDPEAFFVAFATLNLDVYAEFGRELDPFGASKGGGPQVHAPTRERLVLATCRVRDAVRAKLAELGFRHDDSAITLLWAATTGLAAHYTGPRRVFHKLDWDEAVWFAARTLMRGLEDKEAL